MNRTLTIIHRRTTLAATAVAVLTSACAPDQPMAVPAETLVQADSKPVPAPLYTSGSGRGRPDHYIVKLRDEEVPKGLTASIAAEILKIAVADGRRIWPEFRGFYARIPKDNVDKVREHPLVRYVEEDEFMQLDAVPPDDGTTRIRSSRILDSGVQRSPPWHLDRIDQARYPLDGRFAYNYSGRGVTIYVIDSGIRTTHTDFGGRASVGYEAGRWNPPRTDCHGHGTHVASAAAGTRYGVAKHATIVGVRVFGCRANISKGDVIDGMEWVTRNRRRPAVVVMSLRGSDGPFHSMSDAAADLINAGVTVVKSAGNDAQPACRIAMHRVGSVIVVGALARRSDTRTSISNFGTCVDLYAPGSNMSVATYTGNAAVTRGFGGTSASAPLVAGAAAMYLERYPRDSPVLVHSVLKWGATPTYVAGGDPDRVLYVNQPKLHGVSWTGPTSVSATQDCAWRANAIGGRPPFTYTWSGVLRGNGQLVSGRMRSSGYLHVRVVDSSGQSATYRRWVVLGTAARCPN